MMNNLKGIDSSEKKLGIFIIANAIVWGAVIIAVASALKGTGMGGKVTGILSAGSIFSVIFLPVFLMKKKK